jgi:outer membrane immunogenic protein
LDRLLSGLNGGGWGQTSHTATFGAVGAPALTTGNFNTRGGLAGGTIGYNYQLGQWLVGAEADLDWSNIRGTFNGTAGAAAFSLSSQLNWLDTTRVQVGWVWDHALFYGTAGAAAGGVTTTASASAAIAGSARRLPLPIRKLASAGPPVAAPSMPSTTMSVPSSNTCT